MDTDAGCLRAGKAAQAVLDRSVLRPLRKEGVLSARSAVGADYGECPGAAGAAVAADTVLGRWDLPVGMLISSAAGNLAMGGYLADRLLWTVVFPASMPEEALKGLTAEVGKCCRILGLTVEAGHTQISSALRRPVVSVTVLGEAPGEGTSRAGSRNLSGPVLPGMSILMAGYTAEAGCSVLTRACRRQLSSRFGAAFLAKAQDWHAQDQFAKAVRAAREEGCAALHDVSRGGVLGSLWELGEREQIGFRVYLRRMLLRQETIEICEWLDVNPYRLYGQGSLLAVTGEPERLMARWEKEGMEAVCLGMVTEGRARLVVNGEDVHYLEKPLMDELCRCEQREEERRKSSWE